MLRQHQVCRWVNDDCSKHWTLRNRGDASGFLNLLAPFIASALRKASQNDLARLKQLLE